MKNGVLKILLGGGGVGAGGVLLYELFRLFEKQPALAEKILEWGPLFAVIVVGGFLVDRRMGQFVGAMQSTATAMQGLSDAVQEIGSESKERADAQDAALRYVGKTSETLLSNMEEISGRLGRIEGKLL